MSRPSQPPPFDERIPCTPRVAAVGWLKALGAAADLPFDDSALAEVLPIGMTVDDNGRDQWVAVRVQVDLPTGAASFISMDWILRADLEALMPMRIFLTEAPDDLASFDTEAILLSVLRELRAHPAPSRQTRQRTKPGDGFKLLASWTAGARPVLRTIAWVERAITCATDSVTVGALRAALELLQGRHLGPAACTNISSAIAAALPSVGHLLAWPEHSLQHLFDVIADLDFVDDEDIVDLEGLWRDEQGLWEPPDDFYDD